MADITAARINNLQNRIALVYGNGSGTNGYGQSLSSSQVDALDGIVRAEDLNNIYTDILNARVHQVGPGDLSIAQVTAGLNVVAEDTSNFIDDDGDTSNDPTGFKKGIVDFEDLMTEIEADKFLVHPSQSEQKLMLTDPRSTSWNGEIYHEFTVTFNNADHRRHFFNSGGQIRFSATNSGARTSKGLDWSDLLGSVGTISFGYEQTFSGPTVVSNIGNYDLTSSFQTVYTKNGTGYYSNVYAGNNYRIAARASSSNILEFRVYFDDIPTAGTSIDNNVDGRLESNIQLFIATGNYVSIAQPSFYTTNSLSGYDAPADPRRDPEYSIGVDLARDQYEIDDGPNRTASVDYLVTAVNVDYPITLYWDTQVVSGNVTASDFTDNTLTGSITITSAYTQAERTINRTLLADSFTEGEESFRLRLYTDSNRNSFVDSTGVVTIIDNSVGVTPAPTPTYAITRSSTDPSDDSFISEGQYTAFYGVQTTEVPQGTTLYYTIVGNNISASDIVGGSLSGSFTIDANGEGSFSVAATADATSEGVESFDIQLRTGSTSGTIVLETGNGGITYIRDTSLTPPQVRYISNSGTEATEDRPGLWKWIAPAGVTSVRVRTIGGGGAGYATGGGGGGGGGFGEKTVSVTPGVEYDVQIGSGGLPSTQGFGQSGDATWFRSLSEVSGRGGTRGGFVSPNTTLAGGGNGGGYVGTSGGNGGPGGDGYYQHGGGGGGGAGGPDGSGGAGGSGGRSISGIAATEGQFGEISAGGGGGGAGTTSNDGSAGGGGGTGFSDSISSKGAKGTPQGANGSPGGSGTGMGSASTPDGGTYGGGGGSKSGSGITFGASAFGGEGGPGAINLQWSLPEPEPETPDAKLNISTQTLSFTSSAGVRPNTKRLTFTAENGNVEVYGVNSSLSSAGSLSLDYTGASGSPSGGAPFTVTPSSPKYIDVSFYGLSGSASATINIDYDDGTNAVGKTFVVAVSWEEEVDLTPTYSISVDSGKANYPTVGDETTYSTFTYTVETTNVPNGTVLYWTTAQPTFGDGVTTADLNGFQGTFTINNNQGSFTRTAIADETTEDTEYFGTEIRTSSYSGPRVALVFNAIQDTSKTPTAPDPVPTYDPVWNAPTEVTRGVRFNVSVSGGAPNTTWVANYGLDEITGNFDANGNFEGNFVIDAVGSYSYTITYSDPTSATDFLTIRVVDPEPISQDTPANLSPQSKVGDIPFDGRRHITTGSTRVTNASTTETLNFTAFNTEKPQGSSVGIYPSSFTLAPGASITVAFAGNSPANYIESYEYKFGIIAAGKTGSYPEFTLIQFRIAEGGELP